MDFTVGGIFLLLILCPGGYGSSSDGPFLLVADNYLDSILQINVTSGSNATLPMGDPRWPLSLDYDPNTDYVYWSDRLDRHIKRARRDGSGMETIVTTGLISTYGLAIDHAAGNLYWTDSRAKTVSVARMDGSFARPLLTSPAVGSPGGLVLDSRNGYMYWTDWGSSDPRIDRAAMDGSNQTTILSDLTDPNMITIDYTENRLYYCDGGAHSIFSADLLGNDVRRHLYLPSDYLFGIAIDSNNIYWTSWTTSHIGMLSRSTNRQSVLVDSLANPNDIYVSMATPTDVTNACSTSNGGCQDLCLAKPEGRTCACRFPWELQEDGTSCLPKKLVSPSYLWLDHKSAEGVTSVKMTAGDSRVIRQLHNQSRPLPVETLFTSQSPSRIEAIDYDFQRNLIFWVDTGLREIHTVELQDGGIQSFSTLFEGISSGVEGLAVDWLNQNLYYTDAYFNWIGVVSYKNTPSRHHVIVHKGLDWPRGIAVHPIAGYVFWSDRGSQNPRIERAVLSGEQRTSVVKEDIVNPSGLVIDGNRLYWADSYRDTIESCDLNGNNRTLFYRLPFTHFYDITYDGEEIMASDWSDDSINFISGHLRGELLLYYRGEGYVYGVEFYDQSRQQSAQTDCQVNNGGCTHTCVGDPDGHRCLCLENFHLAEDNHNCIENEHPFSKALFVGSDSGILQLPHNFRKLPETGDWTDSYLVQGTKAFAMDFDYSGKMIFYTQQQADGTQNIERLSLIGEGSTTTIFENGQGIEGIAVDWVASNLYWTERQLGRIHVSKLDGSLRKVLMSGLDQPSAIAVHPGRSYVFWTEVGADPKISRASPDGSSKLLLVSSQRRDITGNPTALAMDYLQERVYWVTSDPGNVQSCNLNGGDVKTYWSSTNANLDGVAIYKDYVIWTDNANRTLTNGIPYFNYYGGVANMKTTRMSTAPYNIKVYDDTEQPLFTSVCDHQNGLCMELCIPTTDSRVCACAEGRYIQEDRVSCADLRPSVPPTTPPPTGGYSPEDFVLVVDSSTGNISEVNVTSGSNVTLPLHSTLPMALDYDVTTGYVYWSDYVDEKIYRAKRDGSGFEAVINKSVIGVYGIYGLALDYAGQNIYWTDWGTEIVGVAGFDGSNARAVFSENIDYPGGIALDPEAGYMYWTDSDYWRPRIERAAMDGSGRTTLISSGLDTPTGIAIDIKERRLYWGDSGTHNIQSSDMYGNNRRTVVLQGSTSFFDLALHVHDLFWTSRADFIGINAKSSAGQGSNRVLADGFTSLRGIALYGSGLQQSGVTNACSEAGDGCQDMCLARPGGRTCICRAYFVLQKDNTTCAPPEIKAPSYIWINLLESGTTMVRMFEGNSSTVRNLAQQTVQVTNLLAARSPSVVVSLDYDIQQGVVFWIDIGLKEIQEVNVKTGGVTALKTEISTGAEALAADWVNKNLYYTDYNYNRVVMVSYSTGNSNGNSHIIAETGLDRPRGIAVNPSAAYVFWSDWGLSPKIERATLSGEGRTAIVESDLGRPSGLVIDYVNNRLYFADTERDRIESCDFDGGNRRQFYSLSGTHFYDITFDGEEIAATDWSDSTINFIHTSRPILAYGSGSVSRVLGVEFYDDSRQQAGQSDCQVNNGGCQHTCVGDQSGHKCLCLPDYTLAEDEKNCIKNDHLFTKALLVSTDEGILQFPHNLADLPGTADSTPTVLVKGAKTVAMDFNYNERAVYYAQENGRMQSIQKHDLATNRSYEIYSGPYLEGRGIAGIAVDWVTSNVYWTGSGGSGTISVARLDGSSRKILKSYLNNPQGIAVHPELKLLFWTEAGDHSPSISRSTLAGTEQEVIVRSNLGVSIRKPTALSIDFLNSRIYWADSGTGIVMSSNLRGREPQQHWRSNGELFGLAVYKVL
ncbi:prolow-density lipoprotein receptor-related protein 1-like [Branchiostoma floridae x Branchiostoma belcheri]